MDGTRTASTRIWYRSALNKSHRQTDARQVILFFVLQLYALHALYTGYYFIAIAIALPAWLLPYTWVFNQSFESISGVPFSYIFPHQREYSPHHRKAFDGLALEVFSSGQDGCDRGKKHSGKSSVEVFSDGLYKLRLFLALWYSYIGIRYPGNVGFFVAVTYLLILRPEYWGRKHSFSLSNEPYRKLQWGLAFQFLVGTSTLGLRNLAINHLRNKVLQKKAHPSQLWAMREGPALAMTWVVLLKVVNSLKAVNYHRPKLLFNPNGLYWDDSATDEEILIWEMLELDIQDEQLRYNYDGVTHEDIKEYEAAEWQEAEERQRRQRLDPRAKRLDKSNSTAQQAVYTSPEPRVLYRGSQSDEEDDWAVTGPAGAEIHGKVISLL